MNISTAAIATAHEAIQPRHKPNRIRRMTSVVWFGILSLTATAQTQKPPRLTKTSLSNTYKLEWESLAGRTYFVQQSGDLINWTYYPKVMAGVGGNDWMSTVSASDKRFFRLLRSNVPTVDPITADHDGDGIPSYAELTVTQTDPLKYSTAGNGVSDRGLFPNPTSGIYLDPAHGVQYNLVPNPPGVSGPKAIVAIPNFDSSDYGLQFKKGERQLEKKGYIEFTGTSSKRYLTWERFLWPTNLNGDWVVGNWQFGESQGISLPQIRYVAADYNSGYKNNIDPFTGTETITGAGFGNTYYSTANNVATLLTLPWGYQGTTLRTNWMGKVMFDMQRRPFYYDLPPYSPNWDAAGYLYYVEQRTHENTIANVQSVLRANPPAYPSAWTDGNPWATWDVWSTQMGATYQRLKFRVQNKNGTVGDPAKVAVFFDPKSGGARETVMNVEWDGQSQYSPEYTIDPAVLKPGVEGTFHVGLGTMYFELDEGQATTRKAGLNVVIPVADTESSGNNLRTVGVENGLSTTSSISPAIRFPGMDDTWYEGASITLSQISGLGAVRVKAIDPYSGYEVDVPLGKNLAADFFDSHGYYSGFDWKIVGVNAGFITLRLSYSKGATTLQVDRTAIISPKANLTPSDVPLPGLARASVRLSNLGSTKIPILAPNQMPILSIGGVAATDVKQDQIDPRIFYFTPPASAVAGEKTVQISSLTVGDFTFTSGATLQAAVGFNYTDDLQLGLASFSSSIGVSIAESRSTALLAKAEGMPPDDAFELLTSQIGALTNEEMARIKSFSQGKTMTSAATAEFDAMVAVNNSALEAAASEIYGGISFPVAIGASSTFLATPVLGTPSFFTDARQWMSNNGVRVYTGSYGDHAHFAVIEANEFDLGTWTTSTTNQNIYDAVSANPKAKILINGALFNFKSETFVTTGIVYNNGVKLSTSTDPSQGSYAVANLRYWLGQTTDNSMTANGTTAATYQFGGKGHPPVPPAVPGPADIHSSIGGMISCIWPDASGNGQKVTPTQDSDLKVYAAMGRGSMLGYGLIGVDRHTGMMIILSKENGYNSRLDLFDVQNAVWSSGIDQAVMTDGGSSVALAINGSVPVKGARHFGSSTPRDTVTNYFTFTPIPIATITAPLVGTSIPLGSPITVIVAAKGGTGNVTKIEFYQGTTKIGEDSSEPYSVTFTPSIAGASNLSAKVFDDDGGAANSINVPITINP